MGADCYVPYAPKVLGDILESVAITGSIFIDSEMDLEIVWAVGGIPTHWSIHLCCTTWSGQDTLSITYLKEETLGHFYCGAGERVQSRPSIHVIIIY